MELDSLKIDISRLPLEIQIEFTIFVDGNLVKHSSAKQYKINVCTQNMQATLLISSCFAATRHPFFSFDLGKSFPMKMCYCLIHKLVVYPFCVHKMCDFFSTPTETSNFTFVGLSWKMEKLILDHLDTLPVHILKYYTKLGNIFFLRKNNVWQYDN